MFSQYRLRELDSLMAENAINKPPAQPAALPGRRRFSELTLHGVRTPGGQHSVQNDHGYLRLFYYYYSLYLLD